MSVIIELCCDVGLEKLHYKIVDMYIVLLNSCNEFMYPLDPHGVKKWGDMTLPAPMDAPPMATQCHSRWFMLENTGQKTN